MPIKTQRDQDEMGGGNNNEIVKGACSLFLLFLSDNFYYFFPFHFNISHLSKWLTCIIMTTNCHPKAFLSNVYTFLVNAIEDEVK